LSAGRSISANNPLRLTPSLRMILALKSADTVVDCFMEFGERKEAPVAQSRLDEALTICTATANLSLVTSFLGRVGRIAVS
jgi:hypothetical protein